MNKQKIIDYIELLEAKAYQSDDYFKQRNELYILNQKQKEVLDKIKEIINNKAFFDPAMPNCNALGQKATLEILELLEEIE